MSTHWFYKESKKEPLREKIFTGLWMLGTVMVIILTLSLLMKGIK